MYNISEDNLYSCLDFHSENNELQPYPLLDKHPYQPLFAPYPHTLSADPFSTQREKIQKLEPTSHLDPATFSDVTHFGLQIQPASAGAVPVRREIHSIFCSSTAHTYRRRCLKGEAYETQNIGKHLKSITSSYLSLLRQANMLEEAEQSVLASFKASNGSFNDFSQLFQLESLRVRCQQYFSSRDYMSSILALTKMSFQSRLTMIKYAEKLRSLAFGVCDSWKIELY